MTHMTWNKFFTGARDHGDRGDEDETETEDEEEVTESNATASTEKRPYFLGLGLRKFSYNRLSNRCIKFAFILLNSATLLAGIIGSVISTWMFMDNVIMSRLIGQRFFVTTLLLMSLIAFSVSLLGLLGLLRRQKKLLNIFALCYLLFLCVIFISAIMFFWIFELITKRIQDDMLSSIKSYHTSLASRAAWDNTQIFLKCCGINSSKDWIKYYDGIPKICCSRNIDECFQMTEAVAYKSGCLKSAVLLLKSYVHGISISAVLIFLTTLMNFGLALFIVARMKASRSPQN